MLSAPLPLDEKERLHALRQLRILDTPIEERFERIVRLARTIFNTDISSFTLVDERRQWKKSLLGSRCYEDPRAHSFCAHAILGNDIMIVPDARQDPRFADNPLVTGQPKIAFYAGCPVRAPSGHNVGTLCIIDQQARSMTRTEMQGLRDLALLMEVELQKISGNPAQQRLNVGRSPEERAKYLDPLTHAWNDAGLLALLQEEWQAAMRLKQSLAICLVALEGPGADQPQQREEAGKFVSGVVRAMLGTLRNEDSIGRRADGIVMAVLPGCTFEAAAPTAERLRLAIAAMPVEGADRPLISIGMTHCQQMTGQLPETLLRRVEGALSIARKSGGRHVAITSAAGQTGRVRPVTPSQL